MKIIEYSDEYAEHVKDLLVELQKHLASLDERGVIVLKDNYREDYFRYVLEEIKRNSGTILLAICDTVVVGCVVCKIFQGGGEEDITTSCPKIGSISDLVITKTMRGQGIGKQLLTAAEDYFVSEGCEYTQLVVFAPNSKAFELYYKFGYNVNSMYMSKRTGKLIKENVAPTVVYKDNTRIIRMQIGLNEKRMIDDGSAPDVAWHAIDEYFAKTCTKKSMVDGTVIYTGIVGKNHYTDFCTAYIELRKQEWFGKYCTMWIWHDSDGVHFEDILEKECKKKPLFKT